MSAGRHVIIAGGGIAGLTLALALRASRRGGAHARAAPRVTVIERATRAQLLQRDAGTGLGLWGPSLTALRSVGVESRLHATQRVRMLRYAAYRDAQGRTLAQPAAHRNRFTDCLCLHRSDLQAALVDAWLHQAGDDALHTGVELDHYEPDHDGIKVWLKDGSCITGNVLVGADGLYSRVRAQLCPHVQPRESGMLYWRGVADDVRVSRADAFEVWGVGRRFGLVPLAEPGFFWFAALRRGQLDAGDLDVDGMDKDEHKRVLLEQFADGALPPLIGDIVKQLKPETILTHPIRDLPSMPTWTGEDGRVALVGDAVSAVVPNLAQGANLAIQGALQLAEHLDKHGTARDYPDNALRTKVSVVRCVSRMVSVVGELPVPWLARVRDGVLHALPDAVKGPLFDRLHRFILGGSYTPPPIGRGLYHVVLGQVAFEQLPEHMRAFHSLVDVDAQHVAQGTARVQRSDKWLGRLVASLAGLPAAMENGHVRLTVKRAPGAVEQWHRVFVDLDDGKEVTFNTKQWAHGEQLLESSGPLTFDFDLVEQPDSGGFDHVLRRTRVLGVLPMPAWLAPQVHGTTRPSAGGWRYRIDIDPPKWAQPVLGLLVRYEGQIDKIEA